MSNLFFGGSSDIALKIAKNLKSTEVVCSLANAKTKGERSFEEEIGRREKSEG